MAERFSKEAISLVLDTKKSGFKFAESGRSLFALLFHGRRKNSVRECAKSLEEKGGKQTHSVITSQFSQQLSEPIHDLIAS